MEPSRPTTKQESEIPNLLKLVRKSCNNIEDHVGREVKISLPDCIMSGVAMFEFKYPSLLQFDKDGRADTMLAHNLKTLFKVNNVPSDTYFRERLDPVEPAALQQPIKEIINYLQNNKALSEHKYSIDTNSMDEFYVVSVDATGNFPSNEVHCDSCCVKHHNDGSVTYYHQTLAAVMVHPERKTVLPLCIEPITKKDGATKNDCEHSAAKRLLENLRASYPKLKMLIVMDGLYADSVIISQLLKLKFSFIITAKEKDLKYMFDEYKVSSKQTLHVKYPGTPELNYQFVENMSLNYEHSDMKVNVLECKETKKNKETRFCWITNLALTNKTVQRIARAGRARWRIENETFNTLKNQGYNFEHNFGHGVKNLSSVLTYLMFIAFLIDQAQQICCDFFKSALLKCESKMRLWRKMYVYLASHFIDSWEQLYLAITHNLGSRLMLANTA